MDIKKLFIFLILINNINFLFSPSLRHLLNSGKFPKVKGNQLNLSGYNLTDLKGIEKYPGIEKISYLFLCDNKIIDLSPLLELYKTNLLGINLTSNKIKSLAPLTTFSTLKEIVAVGNPIEKIGKFSADCKISIDQHNEEYSDEVNYDDINLKNSVEQQDDVIGNVNVLQKEEIKESDLCSICQDNSDMSRKLYFVKCLHVFHADCLAAWLKTGKNSCPNCRINLV